MTRYCTLYCRCGIFSECSKVRHQASDTTSVPQWLPWLVNPRLFPGGIKFCILRPPVLGQSPPGHYPSGQSPVGRRRQRDRFKESIKDQYSCFADWMTCKSTYTPPPPWTKWPPFRRMWNFCILIKISLKLVFHGPIDNNPALVQIMAWRRIGDKPLSEPMLTQFTDAFLRH